MGTERKIGRAVDDQREFLEFPVWAHRCPIHESTRENVSVTLRCFEIFLGR